MSQNLPNNNTPEEVDLGQLFSLIERLFKRIGDFISKILKMLLWLIEKLGILILVILNILKKHVVKIALVCGIVYGVFYGLNRFAEKKYESDIIISQNFQTGRILYTTVSKLNTLAKHNDSIALSKELDISLSTAANIAGFTVGNFMNQNQFNKDYYEFIRSEDSIYDFSQEDFRSQVDFENFPSQKVSVISTSKDVFNASLSGAILKVFEDNLYYNEQKKKSADAIKSTIAVYENMLKKSEDLQQDYVGLLKTYYNAEDIPEDLSKTNLNVNLNNSKEKINTKEFDLLKEQQDLKLKIAELKVALDNTTEIVRLQRDFTTAVPVDSFYKENKKTAVLITLLILILFYLIKEFKLVDMIDQYGTKEKLSKL